MNIILSKTELSLLKKILNSKEVYSIKGIDTITLKDIISKLGHNGGIKLFVDGAADLHSKTAGIGGIIYRNNDELFSFSEFIGQATNNEAEYKALIRGLRELIKLNIKSANIFADSELVVKQINGEYKVKNDRMKVLHQEAIGLLARFDTWSIKHVLRDKNSAADKLSKEGMRARQ